MPSRRQPRSTYVALLRGINVGGKNIITMDALRASFEALGYSSVRTLIASGNVVFEAGPGSSRRLEQQLERALAADHRFDATVVVRSREEYERMMTAIPPRWGNDKTRRHYVMFLRRTIDRAALVAELGVNAEVEELRYVPGALLWSCRLDAVNRSKVRKVMARAIYRDMTVRNLNTTRKTWAVMQEGAG